jgi:hypothetical protein
MMGTKNMKWTYLLLVTIILIQAEFGLTATEDETSRPDISFSSQPNANAAAFNEWIQEIDKATERQWEKLVAWQNNTAWLNEMLNIRFIGTIFEGTWAGPNVKRNILPGKTGEWLVVDSVTIEAGLGVSLPMIVTNIFFLTELPYLQIGPIKEKHFVNVRSVPTYKAALLSPPFSFQRLPVTSKALEAFEVGEILSTINRNGFVVAAGANLLELFDAIDPEHSSQLSATTRFVVKNDFNINISRESDTDFLVLIEDLKGKELGLGFGLGNSLEDLGGPIALGVGSKGGFFPFKLNFKRDRGHRKALVYRFNISTNQGYEAFQALIQGDLTVADGSVEQDLSGVTRELVKEGQYDTKEFNFGVNFVLFRGGLRRISTHSQFVSTLSNGKSYGYSDDTIQLVKTRGSAFGNAEQVSGKFTITVPLNKNPEMDSFFMEYEFSYADSSTTGKELAAVIEYIEGLLNNRDLIPEYSIHRNYGDLRALFTLRFPVETIRALLKAESDTIWIALGDAYGILDPYDWGTKQGRKEWKQRASRKGKSLFVEANRLFEAIVDMQSKKSLDGQAQALIKILKKSKKSQLLLDFLVNLIGTQRLQYDGLLRGNRI